MREMDVVHVTLHREMGWWTARSRELPDLYVAHRDVGILQTDMAATIKALMLADHGVDCAIQDLDLKWLTDDIQSCSVPLHLKRLRGGAMSGNQASSRYRDLYDRAEERHEDEP